MNLTIRPFREGDTRDVLVIWLAASRVGHPFLSEDFLRAEQDRVRDVHLPTADTWVCEEQGRVMGFVAMLGHEVGAMFVDPEVHGRGVGRALLDHVRPMHETLELEVFEENAGARAFYERYGFRPVSAHDHAETGRRMLRLGLAAPA